MDQQKYARKVLMEEYGLRKTKNPNYSLRAFARSLDVSVSTLSEFFSEKKHLGPDLIFKLVRQVQREKDLAIFQILPLRSEFQMVEIDSVEEVSENHNSVYKLKGSSEYFVPTGPSSEIELGLLELEIIEKISKLSKARQGSNTYLRIRLDQHVLVKPT